MPIPKRAFLFPSNAKRFTYGVALLYRYPYLLELDLRSWKRILDIGNKFLKSLFPKTWNLKTISSICYFYLRFGI